MAQFTEAKINCILQEYFALCVMIYRVKSKINYTWTVSHDIEDVINLFQTNQQFRSKQAKVVQYLFNLFSGTEQNEPVLGNVYKPEVKQFMAKAASRKSSVGARRKTIFLPQIEVKDNGYEKVAHLVPDVCDVSRDFLGVMARFQILGSPQFRQILQKVTHRDPSIMS